MSKKILIVDDEADQRTFLSTVLEENGYASISAKDGV
ncbi:MAG: response regulator, partial [Deltaproteobacteria bacterium]|nr:response regulator [Deltaproteobacteria bacterium]